MKSKKQPKGSAMSNRLNVPDELNFLIEKRTRGDRRKQSGEGETSDGRIPATPSPDGIAFPDRRKRQRRVEPDTSGDGVG
jgi:hypothetical protein